MAADYVLYAYKLLYVIYIIYYTYDLVTVQEIQNNVHFKTRS